ncbi:uncharacterized protein LOC124631822 [Helicoverpa zea]|uniref:uncharacterized protein LOC124631822 n=1 Tax=Helicoverpa zea TaxID=7113 RepID=UPI001F5678E6|nr:uncharacterized protein LOC124631822 [Helicoverpa zea]XP_047022393.1 uncharacterized protein LOC124631822 [Helicoverpa zea]XP_047022394.1 uncharacterized protein LOC124631822 [Helicoverpa zea]
MDVSFNNVLEGTRQYFMGVPKQAQADGSGQPLWPSGAPLPEEGAPAQSGAPAPSSRPPSAAAAPPSVPSSTPVAVPPRPPSEPIEPEPHIIHKATVMREAAEKRREQPEIEDDEEAVGTLSPPSHIIRKPPRTLPSPAPAPAAPCPSPARPPSAAPLQPPTPAEPQLEAPTAQYRPPVHRVQTPTARQPDHYAPGRPPDPYPTSRPPESYGRYHYDSNMSEGSRNSHGPVASPQPSTHSRQSPQTYARLSGSMPQHTTSRLREVAAQSPPTQRYQMQPTQPPPPPNDRVPPIHHPQPAPPAQRHTADSRSAQMQYTTMQQRRDLSPYGRTSSHYERHPVVPQRKYDHQQAYPSYRPSPVAQPVQSHRVDTHHQVQFKHAPMDVMSSHYAPKPQERSPVPIPPHPHDAARLPPRAEFPTISRSVDTRSGYHYPAPSTSTSRYGPSAPVPIVQNTTQSRSVYHPAAAPKTSYEYVPSTPVQTSPARSTVKPGYPNQARMTVSVTSLVNQMNQTKQKQEPPAAVSQASKQKRESPLDLSVKTVKNSADSSTTQDDAIDSAAENKMIALPHRPSSSGSRHAHLPTTSYVASHKVDFAPNFTQYGGDRNAAHGYVTPSQPGHPPMRYNGSYEARRPVAEAYPVESPHSYQERSVPIRTEYVPKIDLTRSLGDQRLPENRVRDDRHFIIEERKRPAGPIASNIPEKIVRYETWTADSRIDHLNQSAREQRELMKQPVYSYSRYKQQLETYQNEQKRPAVSSVYREHHTHANRRYSNNPYHPELARETSDYHAHYHDRNPSVNSRHQVIQKIPSHRDMHTHHFDPASGIPADKRVLSILRNSLETKHTGFMEPPRQVKHVPDLIVIDDAEDSVIDITDLTKENDTELASKNVVRLNSNHITPNLHQHIQMPKAVDSLPRDSEYNNSPDPKPISPENDVASRIRTKAELKVMPPSQDTMAKTETKQTIPPENEKLKLLPRKTHLFNQIREDNLRLESVIKNEELAAAIIPEVKTEPMNIEEIEKDAEISIKTENILESLEPVGINEVNDAPFEDLDWANACDSFMEQLKSGCHKKKVHRRRIDTLENENESKVEKSQSLDPVQAGTQKTTEDILPSEAASQPATINVTPLAGEPTQSTEEVPPIVIKQEPMDEDELEPINEIETPVSQELITVEKPSNKCEKVKNDKKIEKQKDSDRPTKMRAKAKVKSEKSDQSSSSKKELKEKTPIKTLIKEELESTDDDEPLIKSKILKEKEQSDRLKYQLLKDLSEKSAYVKLECCDVDVNKNTRKSLDSTMSKDKEEKPSKGKLSRQISRSKSKLSVDTKNEKHDVNSSSDSDDDDISVARRLRMRKNTKTDENKSTTSLKTPVKSSPGKKQDSSSASNSSTPVRKPTFGDGSYFHPGWEEELYKYKRSLRMPTRLIAIPRGRSGGPFVSRSGAIFTRGSTSLPDLDPAPLSPAPSSAPSAATDDLYARRPEKLTLDSDLDSNSSYSTPNKLHYDSEASTSTVLSSKINKKKSSSIVDVLIQKCGKKEDGRKEKKSKDKDDKTPKIIPKKSNELLPTPSLGLVKNGNKGSYNVKKEKLMEDIFYLGAFRKETVTAFRNSFIKDTDGLIGATEEFAPVVLKSRTRTESRVLKQRATIKEVFGDERPASAPPTSCREDDVSEEKETKIVEIKKEPDSKPKFKPRKIVKDKLKRRSSSIRDGLRSTKSLKRNDAKGRLMRLKKRNSIMKSLNHKRTKELSANKHKNDNANQEDKDKTKVEGSSLAPPDGVNTKRRLKRLFGRRKFSSGFDYIRKKKKIIRREEPTTKIRRPAVKPSPESVHDIQKEIKGWFINKSIGETHLHRAARLGYTDCVAYCLEKLESDPSAKDNAGFTPLHVAAAKGHVRIARLLLQYGANVSAAAQGGIRPLHEACENSHVEVIRLLLAYGADPLLGTYAGQTPEELTEGPAATLLRLHIADVQGNAIEPWRFPPPTEIIDREEIGCDALSSPPPASPPPPPDSMIEIQCTEAPLPPFYSLRTPTGQPADGLWCLLQDITNLLQIKSKDSLLKQIHCGSGSPKELLREIRTQEFLERAQCHQLLGAGEKVNVRASKVALVRVTDKLRQLLKIETVLVS